MSHQSLQNLSKLDGVPNARRPSRSSKTPEGKVKEQVRTLLERHDAWFFMPSQSGFGRRGIPDFIVCYKGRFLAIETKSKYSSHKVTPLQKKELDAIKRAYGAALVVNEDNLSDISDFIVEVDNAGIDA